MFARIQSLFARGYSPLPTRPLPTRPIAAPRASGPPPPARDDASAAPGATDALARWSEVFERRYEADPVFSRIDVAQCLGEVIRAIDAPAIDRPVQVIGRLLESADLLEAVIAAGRSVAVEYREFAEDIQTAYLVALGMAISHDCLPAENVLGLLVGQAGRADVSSGGVSRAYAHHMLSLESVSERHAFTFAKIVDLAVRKSEQDSSQGVVRAYVRRDLLVQKGYGPTGRSNFYSSIALGAPSSSHARILRVLVEFDLLPLPAELALKGGRRGRELELALAAAIYPSCADFRGTSQDEMEWLSSSFEASLSPANLETLREQHRGRMAIASARARQLENALMVTGLR